MKDTGYLIYESTDWVIRVAVSKSGKPYIGAWFRGVFMGFVNLGDLKTTNLFLSLEFPGLIETK